MNIALCFFPVMPCVKPSIPSNSRIIYPRTDQVRYTHGTTLYLACHEGHLLTGSPLWSVTIPRGWKENSSASVCFFFYYHVTCFTSLTQSCVKLWQNWRVVYASWSWKSFLATLLRGSVAFSEKVVYKNECKLTTTFSMNCKLFWSEKSETLLVVFHCAPLLI